MDQSSAVQPLSISFEKRNLISLAELAAGMLVGATAALRQGGVKILFTSAYTPSPLGSFVRAITFDTAASSTPAPGAVAQ